MFDCWLSYRLCVCVCMLVSLVSSITRRRTCRWLQHLSPRLQWASVLSAAHSLVPQHQSSSLRTTSHSHHTMISKPSPTTTMRHCQFSNSWSMVVRCRQNCRMSSSISRSLFCLRCFCLACALVTAESQFTALGSSCFVTFAGQLFEQLLCFVSQNVHLMVQVLIFLVIHQFTLQDLDGSSSDLQWNGRGFNAWYQVSTGLAGP